MGRNTGQDRGTTDAAPGRDAGLAAPERIAAALAEGRLAALLEQQAKTILDAGPYSDR